MGRRTGLGLFLTLTGLPLPMAVPSFPDTLVVFLAAAAKDAVTLDFRSSDRTGAGGASPGTPAETLPEYCEPPTKPGAFSGAESVFAGAAAFAGAEGYELAALFAAEPAAFEGGE